MNRSLPLLLAVLLTLSGCSREQRASNADPSTPGSDSLLDNVKVQLNWYPESEHGGVFQAQADGTFTAAGLNVDILPGGRATPVAPELELGRVQFAFANADDVVAFRRQGMDIVAVLAAMQNSPRCIMVHADSGVQSFDELSGMTLQRQAGRPFVDFLRSKGVLKNVQEVPYHGSVASLVADPNIAIQAYVFAEPLLARQQGVEVNTLMVSDLGWNPYSSVLITSGTLIREQPELVRRMVQATRKGWQYYLTDPTAGNQAILAANEQGMTEEVLQFGSTQLRELALPDSMPLQQVGQMSAERWQTLVKQMDELAPQEAGKVKAEECFTVEFLE